MARKVFISVLGTGLYERCKYVSGDFCSSETNFIQFATLQYLQYKSDWSTNSKAFILLTDKARTDNWEVESGQRYDSKKEVYVPYIGLKKTLKDASLPFPVENVSIPDGKDEEEMWQIFENVFNLLEEGDELHFDLTHSFRYLPMLMLVVGNYAKFLKNASVCSITYGNFEARDKINNEAPIVDLLPLSSLQDWTFAAADFLKNGNASKFKQLATEHKTAIFREFKTGNKEEAGKLNDLANSLQRVTNDLQTCRGKEILEFSNFSLLKKNIDIFGKTVIEPLNPIIHKIEEAFLPFEMPAEGETFNFRNGFVAADWCIHHGLFQQAATILQENVVSFFCSRHGLNIFEEEERREVNTVFAFIKKLNNSKVKEEEKEQIRKTIKRDVIYKSLFDDPLISRIEVVNAFTMLTDERNDINHSGMRPQPHSAETIRQNIMQAYKVFLEQLSNVSKQ